jgi:phenylacetate-coenzyme A ligase PaaK-like adenylate-forming protein
MIPELIEFAGLLRRKRWSRERLDDLRRAKLRRLIHHAYDNVPYYRRLMDRSGVRPADIREASDLVRLPVTTKADLRRADAECLAPSQDTLTVLHTSGHSGAPFAVRLSAAEYRTRRLREFRMLIGTGVRPRDRLTLLGPVRTRPERVHRRLGFYRLEVIPGSLPDEEQLRRFQLSRPDVLWAYPATLKTMLHRARCRLHDLARPRFLITSSEVMDRGFREQLLTEMPEMEIVNIYGSAEAGRIAAECRARRGLHLEDDALIVELLDNGSPVTSGSQGTVVVTCLDQLAMPLIRYEQGDIAQLRSEPCGCGWQTPVMEPPSGRNSDMITLARGTEISCLRLEVSLRHEMDLLQYRFVQERLDRIQAQLCFRQAPTPAKLGELKRRMEEAAGGEFEVDIELVPEVRLEGVKFKVFVSKL